MLNSKWSTLLHEAVVTSLRNTKHKLGTLVTCSRVVTVTPGL